MIRLVTDDLYQLGETIQSSDGIEVVQVFVMLNEGEPVLIDCGSHLHREAIMADLDGLLGDRVPTHIFLTHSELPHAGNIAAIAAKWPGIKVIVSNVMLPYIEVLPVLPLEQMIQVVPGTRLAFPNRTLEFVDALLKDQPGSQWIYDHRTQTMFTGDGFGYIQKAGQEQYFSDEIAGGIQVEQFKVYHQRAFRFFRWIRPERFNADLERMFTKRPVSNIAPIHGGTIRGDVPLHVSRLKMAIQVISQEYRQVV